MSNVHNVSSVSTAAESPQKGSSVIHQRSSQCNPQQLLNASVGSFLQGAEEEELTSRPVRPGSGFLFTWVVTGHARSDSVGACFFLFFFLVRTSS